jgi:hypothetical protein
MKGGRRLPLSGPGTSTVASLDRYIRALISVEWVPMSLLF